MPLYLACVALPLYPVSSMLDGLARPYNAVNIALLPPFVLRPLMLIATMAAALALDIAADATTAMAAFAFATWITTLVQLILFSRCIARKVPTGPRRYDVSAWIKLSSPIFAVWAFDMLLTYTDILVFGQFRPPEEVAHYYAAAKILPLVHHRLLGVGGGFAPVRRPPRRRRQHGARGARRQHRALDVLAVAPR